MLEFKSQINKKLFILVRLQQQVQILVNCSKNGCLQQHIMIETTISLKEEEVVIQILAEVGSNKYTDLDEQLEEIIRRGQAEIEAVYEAQAEQRMVQHRQGINFEQIKETFDLQLQQQKIPEPPKQLQSELQLFQKQTINKSKRVQKQIMELDSQFPKLNFTSMVGQQQEIIQLKAAEAARWVSFKKLQSAQVQTAVMYIIGEKRWIIMGVQHELVIFMGQYQREPIIMRLNGIINAVAVSLCKKYVYVAADRQINVYEIRKATNLVLLKNFADLRLGKIIRLVSFQGAGPRVCFWDQNYQAGFLSLEIGMILTKVKIEQIPHTLSKVQSLDVLSITPKCSLLCVGGSGKAQLFKIQPQVQNLQILQVGQNVSCSWRRPKQKMHLLIASQNKINIYKLVLQKNKEIYYLQQHLLFLNHYQIQQIYRISDFHYLIQSTHNFAIVALPLIQTVVEDPDLSLSEAAIVFSFQRNEGNQVIGANEEGILLKWKKTLHIGKLKTLEQIIDQLIMQKCAYREAFSLLVLIAKGINYSFKFSYFLQDLKRVISASVDMAISATSPKLDQKIVLFRVGWIVQFCIQCGQQQLLWSHLYPRLKQKRLEKHLFNMIQIFVLKCQLVAIPEEIFLEIVGYYSEMGQEQVIEKLVLSNRQQYEPTKLMSLLNQRQMNYLQFYLFSRAIISDQNDFYTPYIRAFSAFSKRLEQKSQKIQESALLCFWILTKTFSFEHIPSGHMTRDTKIEIATNFFLKTLSKTFVRKLSDYNHKIFLQSYLIPFFNCQFLDIISEQQAEVMKNFKQFEIQGEAKKNQEFFPAYLQYLQHCVGAVRSSPLFAQYYCTILFITKSQASFQRVIQLMAALFQKKFYYYNLRLNIGERPAVSKLKQYMLSLIKQDLKKRADRLYIKKLLAFEDREIGHLLYRIDKNYQSALQLYLGNFGVKGLFSFTTSIVEEIKQLPDDTSYLKERKMLEVRGFIIKNIGLLFRTDNNAALQLCYLIGETTQKMHEIIFKNPFENNERIYFLTAVLTRWNNQEFQFKQQYQLQHLQEVCMLPEAEMRNYLDRFYYPLDPAIKVADKKNNFLAKAILEMRSGLIEHAFASYEKLIKTTLVSNKGQEQSRDRVSRYIDECIAICKQYSGQSLQQNLWVRLIKFLASFVASENQYKVYLKVELERASQNIINEMLRFLSTTLLILFFTSPSIPLPMYKLNPIYIQLFKMEKFDKSNIQRSMLIVKLDLLDVRREIGSASKKAVVLSSFCDFCREKLQQQSKNLGYSCGHAFHQLCHEDTSICLTCFYESDDGLFYRNIFKKNEVKKQSKVKEKKKMQMNKDIYVETKTQALLQSRKKKLKLFDFENDIKANSLFDLANKNFKLGELQLTNL